MITPHALADNSDAQPRAKISVIIPSYNSRDTIEDCVRSVLATGYQPLEVLVVDDASTDGSDEIVRRLADVEEPGVVWLLRQAVNGGPARARNAGARQASGEFYFFLDSDTVMNLPALANFAQRIKDADAVVGVYDSVPLNAGMVPAYKAMLNNYFFSRRGVIPYEVFDSARAGIRAEVFDAVGGFNDTLTWGMDYENEELGYRIHRRYRMLLDPDVAVRHMYPGFKALVRAYFFRVALWMEIFFHRRKFESGGVTSAETGISSAALLLACLLAAVSLTPIPAAWSVNLVWLAGGALLVYLYGYWRILLFVARKRPSFLIPALLQNFFFTCVIAAGASYGLLRAILGRSTVAALTEGKRDV